MKHGRMCMHTCLNRAPLKWILDLRIGSNYDQTMCKRLDSILPGKITFLVIHAYVRATLTYLVTVVHANVVRNFDQISRLLCKKDPFSLPLII